MEILAALVQLLIALLLTTSEPAAASNDWCANLPLAYFPGDRSCAALTDPDGPRGYLCRIDLNTKERQPVRGHKGAYYDLLTEAAGRNATLCHGLIFPDVDRL
jgi:hypothetical protein